MATSGTYNFSMNINEIVEDALDMVGGEQILGGDPAKARRALNLLFIDMQNRGFGLWTLEEATTTVTQGTAEYAMTSATNDILSAVVRTSAGTQQDIALEALGYEEYLSIPNKEQQSRPTQIFVRRDRANPTFVLWPTPDSTYEIVYWRIRQLQDVGNAHNDPDVPKRFLPCLPFGLAYYMGYKRQITDPKMMAPWRQRMMDLQQEYENLLANAQGEDRSRVDMKIVPRLR